MEEQIEGSQKGGEAGNQDKNSDERVVAPDETEMPMETNAPEEKFDENGKALANDNSIEMEEKREDEDNDQIVVTITDGEKEPVHLSIWVWVAVLKFIKRMEMAERVSLVCHGLRKLCWPRLHGDMVTPHMVEELLFINGENDENGQPKAGLRIVRKGETQYSEIIEDVPIATAEPPDYIQGIKSIIVYYMDSELLQFIGNISPLFADLYLFVNKPSTLHHVQNFLAALNCSIHCLHIASASFSIVQLRKDFPGLVEKIPAFSVDVVDNMGDWLAVNELISAKVESGQHPFFYKIALNSSYDLSHLMDGIKKTFQTATRPHSFMIDLTFANVSDGLPLDLFRLENEGTGEMLALEGPAGNSRHFKLYRCPRGEAQQWKGEAPCKFMGNGTAIWL